MAVVAGSALALAAGWLASDGVDNHLLITGVLFLFVVGVLELVRRTRTEAPWWVAYVTLLPWAVVVIVPWVYYSARGSWRVISYVDPALPATWVFHLWALLGFAGGTLFALVHGGPKASKSDSPGAEIRSVKWRRVSFYLAAELGLFLFSFVVARRPLRAMWTLSGPVEYHADTAMATPLTLLDNMNMVATGTLLVASAARRRMTVRPHAAELGWLVVLGLQTFGTGARSRFYLIMIGWLVIQFGPLLVSRSGVKRLTAACGAVILLASSFWLSQTLAAVRSRSVGSGHFLERAAIDLDVLGAGELLFQQGAYPGILGGASYQEFPLLLLPRRFVESKPNPAAGVLMRELVSQEAGLAAALWIESALNFGGAGVIVFCSLFSYVSVRVLMVSRRSSGPFNMAIGVLGPVWVLVGYFTLSRFTLLDCVSRLGFVILGVYVGGKAVVSGEERSALATEANRFPQQDLKQRTN